MPKETFQGLDSLIFDQPDLIDLREEPQGTDENPDDKDSKESGKDAEGKDKDKPEGKDKNKLKAENNLLEIETKDDDLEEEDEEGKRDDTPGAKTQEDLLKGWADYFKENTLLEEADLEGFDGTADGLTEAFKKREIRVGMEMVDDYKSQLPDMLKYLADNWEEGVPLTELLNIKSNQIRYSNVTDEKLDESVDTQKAVHAEYLRKTTKFSDTKIEKEIQRLLDLDELKDEAKEGLKELKKFEAEAEETIKKETKKQKDLRLAENAETIKKYTKLTKETKEVIPGIKIDDKLQEEILNKVINPVGIDGYGNPVSYIQSIRNTDPYAFDIKLNYIMTLTKGLTDFSKITNTATTKATKELSKILSIDAPKATKDGIKTTTGKSVLDYLQMPQNKNK